MREVLSIDSPRMVSVKRKDRKMDNRRGVLLIDWENLAGTVSARGFRTKGVVEALVREARRVTDDRLTHAHAAAQSVDDQIADAFKLGSVRLDPVGSAKQQADIFLCVLAMDYLNQGFKRFVIVTGDQDFLPLLRRIYQEEGEITLVYGDEAKLGVELLSFLESTPGVQHRNIDSLCKLEKVTYSSDDLARVALLELQRRGRLLSGASAPEKNILELSSWGLVEPGSTESYWALIDSYCERVVRRDVLGQKTASGWLPANKTRTILKAQDETLTTVLRADSAVNLMQHPKYAGGISAADLRTGMFAEDGSGLEMLSTLSTLGIARRGAGNLYALSSLSSDIGITDGYLEPLWRVVVEVQARCYEQESDSASGAQFAMLQKGGVGRDHTLKRSKARIDQALRYARAGNVIDDRVVGGERRTCVTDSRLGSLALRGVDRFLRTFGRATGPIAQAEVLAEMKRISDADPFLGLDDASARRALRIMGQSGLVRQRSGSLEILPSAWKRSI